MKEINDGGPAFPVDCDSQGEWVKGMSLRDWFAGMAMNGDIKSGAGAQCDMDLPDLAKWSYSVADAMLAARKAKESTDGK